MYLLIELKIYKPICVHYFHTIEECFHFFIFFKDTTLLLSVDLH